MTLSMTAPSRLPRHSPHQTESRSSSASPNLTSADRTSTTRLPMTLGLENLGAVEQVGPDEKLVDVVEVGGWGFIHRTCEGVSNAQTVSISCLAPHTPADISFPRPRTALLGARDVRDPQLGPELLRHVSYVGADFPFDISEELGPERAAAPMIYTGATVLEIVDAHDIRLSHRVCVVGLGGLGHLAGLFASGQRSSSLTQTQSMKIPTVKFRVTKCLSMLITDASLVDHLIVQPIWTWTGP